jgi:hypothetical protein
LIYLATPPKKWQSQPGNLDKPKSKPDQPTSNILSLSILFHKSLLSFTKSKPDQPTSNILSLSILFHKSLLSFTLIYPAFIDFSIS